MALAVSSYPKICQLGMKPVKDIFFDEVTITEKIDGCVCLNEPILMFDLSYKKAGELKIGDELIGFDEELNGSRLRKSVVTNATIVTQNCYEVVFDNGKSIFASEQHPFVVRFPKKTSTGLSKKYVDVKDLKIGMDVLDVGFWKRDTSYMGGYIAGQYDGEGSLIGRSENHKTVALSYYQKEGDGAEQIYKYLTENHNFTVSWSKRQRKEHWKVIDTLIIRGGWLEAIRFVGIFRPPRIQKRVYDKDILVGSPMNGIKTSKVIEIRSIGEQKVMGLSTTTKTYIAKGLLSHNSQFCVGKVNGKLYMRSKGAVITANDFENIQNLFKPVAKYFISIQEALPDDVLHYGETLCRPKHNTLAYDTIPKNHFSLFGVWDMKHDFWFGYDNLVDIAERLNVDVVPLLYKGKIASDTTVQSVIDDFLTRTSYLGGQKIEGVVITNYYRQTNVANDIYTPFMSAKFVSEAFKEVHRGRWNSEETGKGRWGEFCNGYNTIARREKAVLHLRERGEISDSPQDIGKILREINIDIEQEEKEVIKDFLWNLHKKELLSAATKGVADWYKRKLMEE